MGAETGSGSDLTKTGLFALIRESIKTDSNISQMRLLNYLTFAIAMAIYVAQVIVAAVYAFTHGSGFTIVDIPTALASLVGGVVLAKAIQTFGEPK